MADKNVFDVAYQLSLDAMGLIAVAKDSYFREKLGTSYQDQISDLDVEIPIEHIDTSTGLIPLDVGGVAVTEVIRDLLISLGCRAQLFRKMNVNGKRDVLWQVKVPGSFVLLNSELEHVTDSSVYRGPIDETPLALAEVSRLPIGCLLGREDYQEQIFSKRLYDGLVSVCDVSNFFIALPLYNRCLVDVVNGKFDLIPNGAFENCSSEFLDSLRSKELMALLNYASRNSISELGNETYSRLKASILPFEDKRTAMNLYRGIKSI